MGGRVAGCRRPQDVLSTALRFEKDSVVLYTTMKEVVPEKLGRDSVERSAREEISHVALLQAKLRALGTA